MCVGVSASVGLLVEANVKQVTGGRSNVHNES